MKRLLLFTGLIIMLILASCQNKPADLVLYNGKVVTLDSSNTVTQAVAVQGDRILAVGPNETIKKMAGPKAKVIDVHGALVIPGLIEGHAHFLSLGYALLNLDLSKAHTWQDIVDSVAHRVKEAQPGEWIIGRGWHQEKWDKLPKPLVEGYPVHTKLSAVSPDNPVILTHASGHAVFVNQKAMELAGITAKTSDPKGGRIVRDRHGNPTGVLLENAEDLVWKVYNRTHKNSDAQRWKAAQKAMAECLRNGITSFHDAGETFENIDFLKQLAQNGKLKVRLYVMILEPNGRLKEKMDQYKMIGYGNNFLTVRAIKRYMDGALGSRGAWMLKPYSDMPNSVGMNVTPLDSLMQTAELAIGHGFQLCTHAIGDRANREVLNIYEKVFKEHPDKKNLRWRIEHAQLIHPADLHRFARLGVIASMQGIHCTSDGPWVPARIGDKRAKEEGYLWQSLWLSGAVVTMGTDAPVEAVDPMANFYALITRRMKNGQYFYPEQCLTPDQALQAYTKNNAYAAFEEKIKGTLEPGKLADITVLDHDILTVIPDKIPKTKVLYTIVGGKIMYSSVK